MPYLSNVLMDDFNEQTEEQKYIEWSIYWFFTSERGNVPWPYVEYCTFWETLDRQAKV